MNTIRKFAACAATVSFAMAGAVSFAPSADAVTYTTSGLSQPLTKLGDTIGSQYDILGVAGYSDTLTEGTIKLNLLSFTAGINASFPQNYNNVYSISETMTIGSASQQITIPFNLSISYSDTLTVVGGATFSFNDAGTLWQVVLNGLTIGPNPGGTLTGWLTAQVTDPPANDVSQTPLPAALPLFASGLGGMGLFGWWRKRKNATRSAS